MERPDPTDHRKLHQELQLTLAGYNTQAVVKALVLALASAAGFASDTRADGDALIDLMASDAKGHLRLNWDYLQKVKTANIQPAARA
jgi:hypothetical protein